MAQSWFTASSNTAYAPCFIPDVVMWDTEALTIRACQTDYHDDPGVCQQLLAYSYLGADRSPHALCTFTTRKPVCRYKVEKLMEHLKLFSTRINIPRLIRVCEEFHHWKELVFLYVQYDEYDNAAMVMMNHSPVAWEHVLFKDVAVKVSSVEVYYKAISFYLEEHPDLLNDLLKVTPSSFPFGTALPAALYVPHTCILCYCLWQQT